MPSVIQKKSYNSVTVFWLDKDLLKANILKAVDDLVHHYPEIKMVALFGSIAEGRGVPSSDVDILIAVDKSPHRPIDRGLPFQKYFEGIGLGTDLFVYTEEEIATGGIPLVNTALKKGTILFQR